MKMYEGGGIRPPRSDRVKPGSHIGVTDGDASPTQARGDTSGTVALNGNIFEQCLRRRRSGGDS